jgi:hypothetical protein
MLKSPLPKPSGSESGFHRDADQGGRDAFGAFMPHPFTAKTHAVSAWTVPYTPATEPSPWGYKEHWTVTLQLR